MAEAKFTSTTGGGSVDYADGNSMSYDAGGKFCIDYGFGTPHYEIVPEYAPGVDGGGTINYGFRSDQEMVKVCYIGSSEDDVAASVATDKQVLAATPTDLEVAGQSFAACLLKTFEPMDRQARSTGYGTFYQIFKIHIEAVRLP